MNNKATILGCAVEYLPVLFDICNDAYGTNDFHIYQNIAVHSQLEFPVSRRNYDIKIYEPGDEFIKKGKYILYGVTGPYGKQKILEYSGREWGVERQHIETIIHPTSFLAPSTSIESGILIEPGVVISSQTEIEFGVTIKRSASIGHHCKIGEFVEINPGVTISGQVTVGAGSIIGSGAVVRNGITIGKNSVVGMGSVVTKDIPDGVVAFGNPCEVVRENKVRT